MTPQFSVQQGVQNPNLIFRSPALPPEMRPRLLELGYAPHATELLMQGLPLVYSQMPYELVVEYPSGLRVHVERYDELDPETGDFRRYRYRLLTELPSAPR
ncbi:hypothetical protein [Deinococcus sp.]|uniref:hypothetical protein n=1 Tax=Deinococcus sp. TaxID=47478 RepID=UPI003C7BFD25